MQGRARVVGLVEVDDLPPVGQPGLGLLHGRPSLRRRRRSGERRGSPGARSSGRSGRRRGDAGPCCASAGTSGQGRPHRSAAVRPPLPSAPRWAWPENGTRNGRPAGPKSRSGRSRRPSWRHPQCCYPSCRYPWPHRRPSRGRSRWRSPSSRRLRSALEEFAPPESPEGPDGLESPDTGDAPASRGRSARTAGASGGPSRGAGRTRGGRSRRGAAPEAPDEPDVPPPVEPDDWLVVWVAGPDGPEVPPEPLPERVVRCRVGRRRVRWYRRWRWPRWSTRPTVPSCELPEELPVEPPLDPPVDVPVAGPLLPLLEEVTGAASRRADRRCRRRAGRRGATSCPRLQGGHQREA